MVGGVVGTVGDIFSGVVNGIIDGAIILVGNGVIGGVIKIGLIACFVCSAYCFGLPAFAGCRLQCVVPCLCLLVAEAWAWLPGRRPCPADALAAAAFPFTSVMQKRA